MVNLATPVLTTDAPQRPVHMPGPERGEHRVIDAG